MYCCDRWRGRRRAKINTDRVEAGKGEDGEQVGGGALRREPGTPIELVPGIGHEGSSTYLVSPRKST